MMRLSMVASFVLCGCTTTITAPAAPADPASVFLLNEAMHVGIVLPPDPEGGGEHADCFVEFGFGDWDYYVLDDTGSSGATAAVLWPTQGALGRRAFAASTAEQLRGAAWWAELQPIVVDRQRAVALRRRLQAAFDAAESVVERPERRFRFVPYDVSYWLMQTCADEAAEWLAELGCDYWWTPIRIGLTTG